MLCCFPVDLPLLDVLVVFLRVARGVAVSPSPLPRGITVDGLRNTRDEQWRKPWEERREDGGVSTAGCVGVSRDWVTGEVARRRRMEEVTDMMGGSRVWDRKSRPNAFSGGRVY